MKEIRKSRKSRRKGNGAGPPHAIEWRAQVWRPHGDECREENSYDKRQEGRRGAPVAAGGSPVEEVGTVSQRAAVGHGSGGLQRGRQRLELLHTRPGAIASLSLGRGRNRRDLR